MTARLHPEEGEEVASQRVRELLGISWDEQLEWSTPHIALHMWRTSIEAQGVLVFQASKVELTEMRGTSIPQGPLPVILLNSKDAPHGKIFTLVHEFIHILFANAGFRTSTIEGTRQPEDQVLERASNRLAAAVLMPRSEFTAEVRSQPDVLRGSDESLQHLANRIKVSPEALLRRMLSLRMINASLYKRKRAVWQDRTWFKATSRGGPPIEIRVIASVGRPFVSMVHEGYQRNAISSSEVSDYLGIQLKYFDNVIRVLHHAPSTV
ncbi:MAG: ImmA/IrrE family metallo-endopeptidase [Bacteroidota bacterium]